MRIVIRTALLGGALAVAAGCGSAQPPVSETEEQAREKQVAAEEAAAQKAEAAEERQHTEDE
ncbi:MAG TPA: hypothetical protein VM533_13060 [Fimbriiglobus sp.]|jgi:hypothetical protein|nr:hypothetical protein [Fimbriiglobus sp.]